MATFSSMLFVVGLFQLTMGHSFLIGDERFEYQIPSLHDDRQDENEAVAEGTINWPNRPTSNPNHANPCGNMSWNTCPKDTFCSQNGTCLCMQHTDCPLGLCLLNPATPNVPSICAGMQCSLYIDTDGDDKISEEELIADYKKHVILKNNGTLPVFATDEYLQQVAQGIMWDLDKDNSKSLSIAECIGIYKPVSKTATSESDCKTGDFDKDGMVDAEEIIEFNKKLTYNSWVCCKPLDGCLLDDNSNFEVCQKDAMRRWIETEYFPPANDPSEAVESVTVDDCIAGGMMRIPIQNDPAMNACGGCKPPPAPKEASEEAPTDAVSQEPTEAATEETAEDPVVAPEALVDRMWN